MTLTKTAPVDPKTVERTLDAVLKRLPGYERRDQQVEMAQSVAEALNGRRNLLVEAGTGCGKTMAYLVPLLLSGQPIVGSTHTLALQSQLAEKDLLFLQQAFPRPFKFAVAKGRGNYLCVPKLQEAERFILPNSPDMETVQRIRTAWDEGHWEG